MKSEHVLVPLDLVRGPADALIFVQKMAAKTPVCVTLLHVIELNIFPAQPALNEELRTESEAALRKLARLFFGAEQAARINVRSGTPAEEILAEAKALAVDLIVMCGPRRGGLRLLRRRTTQRVVNAAPCPTLVLPHRCNSGGSRLGPFRSSIASEDERIVEMAVERARAA